MVQAVLSQQKSKNSSPPTLREESEQKSIITASYMNMDQVDPLKKREEFAVSLRREKKRAIIASKRKNLVPILVRRNGNRKAGNGSHPGASQLEINKFDGAAQSHDLSTRIEDSTQIVTSLLTLDQQQMPADAKIRAIITHFIQRLEACQAQQTDEDLTKDTLAKVTHFLFMLTQWDWASDGQATNLRQWVRDSGLLSFLTQMLLFCRPRIDTYPELLKEKACELLCKFSLENDDGQICAELCKPEHGLLDLLGDYLNDPSQSDPVKSHLLTTFANICAEINENLKEAVIKRGRVLQFLQMNSDPLLSTFVPWTVYNLYCQGISLMLDSDPTFNLCINLLKNSLNQCLLPYWTGNQNTQHYQPNMTAENVETMVSYTVKFLAKIIDMPQALNQNGNKNRGVIIRELEDLLPKLFDLVLFQPENPLNIDYELCSATMSLLGNFVSSLDTEITHNLLQIDPQLETKLLQTYITSFTDALSPSGAICKQSTIIADLETVSDPDPQSNDFNESFDRCLKIYAHAKNSPDELILDGMKLSYLERLIQQRIVSVFFVLSNLYAEAKIASRLITCNKVRDLLKLSEVVALVMNTQNCKAITVEIMFTLGNLISEAELSSVYTALVASDSLQPEDSACIVNQITALAVKTMEQRDVDKKLIPILFDMLGSLMQVGGQFAKQFFEECGGEDLVENLESSTNKQVRISANDFFEKYFKGGINDGDLFFSQGYQMQPETLKIKTDDERYFDDGEGQHYFDQDEVNENFQSAQESQDGQMITDFII